MPNFRIVSDNAIDRADSLIASTTAGALAASNLKTDKKSSVWRSTVITATTLTATWAIAETIACAALAPCNLSSIATIRVQLYDAVAGGNLLLDTVTLQPNKLACPAAAVPLRGFTAAAAASAYAYGGGACARIWFASTPGVKRMVVTLTDAGNLQGYIEAARLIAGKYWSPTYNADYGASLTRQDLSKHYRTDAGDLMTDAGTRSRKMQLPLSYMPPADRTALFNILTGSGMAWPLLVSLYPDNADLELERDHTIYGRLSSLSAMMIANFNAYSSSLEIEEL
jgi:hypothetical protein